MADTYEDAPPDGGWGYVVVVAGHFSLFLSLGSLTSFGPFIVRLKEYFGSGAGPIGGISGAALFVTLATGPASSALTARFGTRPVVMAGGFIVSVGLVLSSFATKVYQLYLTYGIVSGIGYGIVLTPSMAFFARYFKTHYATANGIGFAGIAVAWIVLPMLFLELIDAYGWKGATLIVAGISANICVCAALFRPPPQRRVVHTTVVENSSGNERGFAENETHTSTSKLEEKPKDQGKCLKLFLKVIDVKLFNNYLFLIMLLDYFVIGLGLFSSLLFLIARAGSYGIPYQLATTLLLILGVASVVGRATHGFIIDRGIISPAQGLGGGLLVCGLVNIFSFPVQNFVGLAIFYGIFGLANGIFHPLTAVTLKDFLGAGKLPSALGTCNICFGLGGLIGPPITGWIFDVTGDYNNCYFYAGAMLCTAGLLLTLVPCIRKKQAARQAKTADGSHDDQPSRCYRVEEKEFTTHSQVVSD
ncbi:monocarboxylate transporter 13-like [Ptychodera flava]|uniref:monocarboxylate transporter 13-like n=1 Tax=Ptychodera flava TaxID=63121 RepID=UPI003969FBF8